jgi:uncharacterized lipoprotein NlpE involved in copper resistance
MKYLSVTIMLCIILLSLNSCNNKTDKDREPSEFFGQEKQARTQDNATIASEIEKISKRSPNKTKPSLSPKDEKDNNQKQNKPFSLNDFRKEMDAAVQDSIKE